MLRASDIAEDQYDMSIASVMTDVSNTLDVKRFADALPLSKDISTVSTNVGVSVVNSLDEEDGEVFHVISAFSTSSTHGITAEELSKVFRIDMDTAKRTLVTTT